MLVFFSVKRDSNERSVSSKPAACAHPDALTVIGSKRIEGELLHES